MSSLRWLAAPLAAFGLLVAVMYGFGPILALGPTILRPNPVFFAEMRVDTWAAAALAFILAGTYTAPSHSRHVAVVLLLAGAILAWWYFGEFYRPGYSPLGRRRLWAPIGGMYAGGATGLLFVFLFSSSLVPDRIQLAAQRVLFRRR